MTDQLGWTTWPGRDRQRPDHGYVYVIGFSSGAVKVGKTTDPITRARHLALDAARFGLTISGAWLSPLHAGFAENERLLLATGSLVGQQLATEFFACDFDQLAVLAAELRFPQAGPVPEVPRPALVRAAARRREVMRMRDEGATLREIAAALNVSLGTVHADCRTAALEG